jgi:hypothetical protein
MIERALVGAGSCVTTGPVKRRDGTLFFGAAARLLMQELSTTVLFEEHERTFTKKH